jgi:hypothetical protein
MPPSVQVLNAALNYNSRAGRASVVSAALSGGAGALPACDLESLGAAAAQLVEDMEDQQVRFKFSICVTIACVLTRVVCTPGCGSNPYLLFKGNGHS